MKEEDEEQEQIISKKEKRLFLEEIRRQKIMRLRPTRKRFAVKQVDDPDFRGRDNEPFLPELDGDGMRKFELTDTLMCSGPFARRI